MIAIRLKEKKKFLFFSATSNSRPDELVAAVVVVQMPLQR